MPPKDIMLDPVPRPPAGVPVTLSPKLGWIEYFDEAGLLHREDGPARVKPGGAQEWWRHGDHHRNDGPAVINSVMSVYYRNDKIHRDDGPALVTQDGSRVEYYQHGELHRVDGPAAVWPGVVEYRQRGELHRVDGPALIVENKLEAWYVFGMLHRLEGPAVIHADGRTERWVAGVRTDTPTT